jgi:NAD(P)-dependent dehydrogenase (short-subunit alcohol dehydrogenase family)
LTFANLVQPGTTETDMGDQVLTMRARNLGTNNLDQARQQALARLPIGRMGRVTDIAKGIVFLASDDAAFMTAPASSSTAASPHNDPPSYARQLMLNPIHTKVLLGHWGA